MRETKKAIKVKIEINNIQNRKKQRMPIKQESGYYNINTVDKLYPE